MRNDSMIHGVGDMFRTVALPFLFLFIAASFVLAAPVGAQTSGGTPTGSFENVAVSGPLCPDKAVITGTVKVVNVSALAEANGVAIADIPGYALLREGPGTTHPFEGSITLQPDGENDALGTFSIDVPARAVPGAYTLTAQFGDAGAPNGLTFTAPIQLTANSSDCIVEPKLSASVTVSNAVCPQGAQATVDVHIADALGLVQEIKVVLRDPYGRELSARSDDLYAGDAAFPPLLGAQVVIDLPADSFGGQWTATVETSYHVAQDAVKPLKVEETFNVEWVTTDCIEPKLSIDAVTVSNPVCPNSATVGGKVSVFSKFDLGPSITVKTNARTNNEAVSVTGTGTLQRGENFTYTGNVSLTLPATAPSGDWVLTVGGEHLLPTDASLGYAGLKGFTVERGKDCGGTPTPTPVATATAVATATPGIVTPTATPSGGNKVSPGGITGVPTTPATISTATPVPPPPTLAPPRPKKPGAGENLAFTGSETLTLSLIGVSLIVLGLLFAVSVHKRTRG